MKDGGWIPVDKRLFGLLPKKGAYSFIEAYISYRLDIENGCENSVNGYSRIWSWSRNKVRNFIEGLRTGKGHVVDNQRTGKGQEIRLFFNNLQDHKDRQRTGKGQARDRQGTITIDNNKIHIPYAEILDDLNKKGGFNYRVSDGSMKLINGRFADGFTKEDFFRVHDNKIASWKDTKWSQYLRPKTLYLPDNFQSYLNESPPRKMKTIQNADGDFIEVPDDH